MRAQHLGTALCVGALGCNSTVLTVVGREPPITDASAATDSGANAHGLVAHWSFDDGTGPVVRDDSGNGHDGATTLGNWIADGRFGGALDLPTGGSVMVVPFPQATASYTVSFWVRVAAADVTDPITVLSTEIYLQGGWQVNLHPNTNDPAFPEVEFAYFVGPGANNYMQARCKCITAGAWTHIAAVVDAALSTLTLYRNGVADTPVSVSHPFVPGNPFLYMGRWNGTGRQLVGALDDIAIYDRALGAAEIAALDVAAAQAR